MLVSKDKEPRHVRGFFECGRADVRTWGRGDMGACGRG